MFRYIYAICAASIAVTPTALSATEIIDANIYGDRYILHDNTIINQNASLNLDELYFASSLWLQNMGRINANIYVCDGCDAYIINSGTINGTFVPATESNLVQIITSKHEAAPIAAGGYSAQINGATDLTLNNLMPVATSADSITLSGATIYYSPITDRCGSWILSGENMIILKPDELPSQSGEILLLPNVSGNGTLRVMLTENDTLHAAKTYIRNNNIYFYLERESDYNKILDDTDEGNFLNGIKTDTPDDKLLQALDQAQTPGEIQTIMQKSFRLNPIRLLMPIRAFNNTRRSEYMIQDSGPEIHGNIGYTISGDTTIYSSGAHAVLPVGRAFRLSLGADYGYIDGADSYNDFTGDLYGGHASLQYMSQRLFLNTDAGITNAKFEVPGILNNGTITSEANGRTIYSDADMGVRFSTAKLSAIPYIGIKYTQDKILNFRATEYATHIGAMLSYDMCTNCDMSYKYSLHISGATNDNISATANIAAWSAIDQAGLNASIGISREEDITYYKISLGGKFWF